MTKSLKTCPGFESPVQFLLHSLGISTCNTPAITREICFFRIEKGNLKNTEKMLQPGFKLPPGHVWEETCSEG